MRWCSSRIAYCQTKPLTQQALSLYYTAYLHPPAQRHPNPPMHQTSHTTPLSFALSPTHTYTHHPSLYMLSSIAHHSQSTSLLSTPPERSPMSPTQCTQYCTLAGTMTHWPLSLCSCPCFHEMVQQSHCKLPNQAHHTTSTLSLPYCIPAPTSAHTSPPTHPPNISH